MHEQLAAHLDGYRLKRFPAWLTLLPPAMAALSSGRADLVHSYLEYGGLFKRRDVPLVLTAHSYMLDAAMKPYVGHLQYLHYRTDLRLLTRLGLARADHVVAVSRFVAERLVDDLGFSGDLSVIHNGVDEAAFTPAPRSAHTGPLRILFCGNLKRAKRAELLVPLANALGSGFEVAYTSGLAAGGRLSGELAVGAARLRCLGAVGHRDMPACYRQADILFMPSAREGFGLCVAEAMACGLPVVAANAGALPELVTHGLGGYLCQVDDLDGFVTAIKSLADDSGLRARMGEYNRTRVEAKFGMSCMVANYRALFERTIDKAQK